MDINVNITIELDRLKDVLCNALEGGSNYWYYIEDDNKKDGEFLHEVPFREDGFLLITDYQEEDDFEIRLDLEKIKKGIQTMATKYPNHFLDIINESDDGTTADVFLQCCLFDDIIYG